MQELRDEVTQYQRTVEALVGRSRDVVPFPARGDRLPGPRDVQAVCSYTHPNVSTHRHAHTHTHYTTHTHTHTHNTQHTHQAHTHNTHNTHTRHTHAHTHTHTHTTQP